MHSFVQAVIGMLWSTGQVVIRWRTTHVCTGAVAVRVGSVKQPWAVHVSSACAGIDHSVTLTNLPLSAWLAYAVLRPGYLLHSPLHGSLPQHVVLSGEHLVQPQPVAGGSARLLVLGDSGQPGREQDDVLAALTALAKTEGRAADALVANGDIAYTHGTEAEFQVRARRMLYSAVTLRSLHWPLRLGCMLYTSPQCCHVTFAALAVATWLYAVHITTVLSRCVRCTGRCDLAAGSSVLV